MLSVFPTFISSTFFIFKTRLIFFMMTLWLFCMMIYFFPHLFPEFVAHAMTPNNLESIPLDNLPEVEEPVINSLHTPNSMRKEAAKLAGHAVYWAFVGFSVALSACTLIWIYSSSGKC